MIDLTDYDWIIFDVDGVLLELTPAETSAYLGAFAHLGIQNVSDDWNSYKKRNDLEIAREVLENHFGRDASEEEIASVKSVYLSTLADGLAAKTIRPRVLPGAAEAISTLQEMGTHKLGLASANLEQAARMRLASVSLDSPFQVGGFAEHGSNKSETLENLILTQKRSPNRLLFIGDQPSDVAAALDNGVFFLGIAGEPDHQAKLRLAGAQWITPDLPSAGF